MSQKRAIFYIRESSSEQDKGFSPRNQERSMRDYAKKHKYKVGKIYKDLVSGTSVEKRIEFKEMINAAEQGEFDIVLVYHTSRFSRNLQEARMYKDHLRKKLGIDVISVTQKFGNWDDPNTFLNEGINELFDAHYPVQLSFWIRSGVVEKRI